MTILAVSTFLLLAACAETEGKNDSKNSNNEDNNDVVTERNENDNNENNENNNNGNENDNDSSNEENEEESVLDAEAANVDDIFETNNGTFTMVAKADDFDPLKTGPITIEIDQLFIASGEVDNDTVRFSDLDSNEVDFIQLDYQLENKAKEDVTFDMTRITISTNTGKQLTTDYGLTTDLPREIMAGTVHSGSLVFFLESDDVEEIESIRLKIDSPRNDNYDEVGDEIDEELEF
ncbi:hypothetical protein MM221_17995 [Salipaludibacillus sp. LMS25]|uniref:hypothetical protein n=1 Tax=Salipaludibacillus sp. LMS25 TaxID=2924031 RepID=UPI0020D1E9A2|nr:hypothetical protein [Salipaludibacillus sp. LMS25]UTR14428.1 hypothetical protein MM221_17995 [Salipaludibacillus sp. LMS25]